MSGGGQKPAPSAQGTFLAVNCWRSGPTPKAERHMNGLIYLVGLVVVILAILSFFGLR
jgi:hypothetical protein